MVFCSGLVFNELSVHFFWLEFLFFGFAGGVLRRQTLCVECRTERPGIWMVRTLSGSFAWSVETPNTFGRWLKALLWGSYFSMTVIELFDQDLKDHLLRG